MVRQFILFGFLLFAPVIMAQQSGEDLAAQAAKNAEKYRADAIATQAKAGAKVAQIRQDQRKEIDAMISAAQDKSNAMTVVPSDRPSQAKVPVIDGVTYRLFVSQSMPGSELAGLARSAHRYPNLSMVFTGYLPGQTPRQFLTTLKQLVQGSGANSITLDPPAFTALKVTQVPTLAVYDADNKPLAWISGSSSVDYLSRQLAAGKRGNLGRLGPVSIVAEVNLAEAIRQRFAKVDWRLKKQQALGQFWKTLPSYSLPSASRMRTRRIDPTFVVNKSITAPDGRIIVAAGQQINPLRAVPFRQHLLIFDGTNPAQVRWALASMRNLSQFRVTLIATRLPATDAASYERFTAPFGRPVTLMSEAIKDRFVIEALPTRVRADGNYYFVDEYYLGARR